MDELTLDGNGMAGLVAEALSADPTTVVRACASCGERHVLGEHRAYRGAGVVLRCPACADVALVVGLCGDELTVVLRGTFLVARA
jgi:predicted RNA-binding Zn-ribbon protein involved in translation (DUF1610 family)